MKKSRILFFLTLILGTVFASCTKDINGPVDLNYLEGKWNFNKSEASTGGFSIPYTTKYLKNEDGCNKDYIEIISGGTTKFGNYTSGCTFEEKVGTWSQNETNVTFSISGSSLNDTFKVATLSATQLILTIDGNYNGTSGTFNLYFTK